MRNHFKKKYRKVRKEMKKDLQTMMKDNKSLQMLVQQIYITHHQRHMLHKVWYILSRKHHGVYNSEFCGDNGLVGKMLCGRYDEFFNNMYFIDKEFYKKYNRRIPETVALGDAHAVAISCMKNNG